MKYLIVILFVSLGFVAQAQQRGTSRDFWFRPVQVQAGNITPKPVNSDAFIGYKDGKWGEVRVEFGTVSDTLETDGTFAIAHDKGSADYNVQLTPVGAYVLPVLLSRNDTTFIINVYDVAADTTLKDKPFTVDYQLR